MLSEPTLRFLSTAAEGRCRSSPHAPLAPGWCDGRRAGRPRSPRPVPESVTPEHDESRPGLLRRAVFPPGAAPAARAGRRPEPVVAGHERLGERLLQRRRPLDDGELAPTGHVYCGFVTYVYCSIPKSLPSCRRPSQRLDAEAPKPATGPPCRGGASATGSTRGAIAATGVSAPASAAEREIAGAPADRLGVDAHGGQATATRACHAS